MSFNVCLLIPIYNHKESIGGTLERLAVYHLPIIIVDDGSDAATQEVLKTLAAAYPLVRLFRRDENGGKGAAVIRGMREAHQAGFSHALQIDADGQHDAADVPRFLECGAKHPTAVVCGKPIYDASVPKGRLYGRLITHFWVHIETLSFDIGDSMCGFRLYPLDSTCALLDSIELPQRMDFDTAILVRLCWRGIPLENLPTRVIYPVHGVSHFNMLRDNLRISRMHTRLFFGMLVRLPVLLGRKARKLFTGTRIATHWSKLTERGSGLGLRILFNCYRLLGERAAQLLLYPVVAYFVLTGGQARRASQDYLHQIHVHFKNGHAAPRPGWHSSFRHMLAFAQSGLDKLSAWMGSFDYGRVDFPNRAAFDRLMTSGQGAVLIGSHLGNLEMARALATVGQNVVINAIVHTVNAPKFNETLTRANANFGVNLIQVSQLGPDTAILLQAKIDRGEMVVTLGDRTSPNEGRHNRASQIDFLGKPASFAQGPYILASLLNCPVYLLFCLREGNRYTLYFEEFAERIELPRRERQTRLLAYQQQYARRLEAYCLKAPYQWFNFYDFWRQDAAAVPPHV